MKPTLEHFLVLGALLFALGLFTVLTRRGALGSLLGIALLVNAAGLNFAAFEHFVAESRGPAGQVFALFLVVISASEAAVAFALALRTHGARRRRDADELTGLRL